MKRTVASLKNSLKYDKVRFKTDPEYKNYILQSINLIIHQF